MIRVTLYLCSLHCLRCCPLQGTCRNEVCVCTPGYSGTYCEVPPACGVILDVNGNCCNHGVVSSAGVCCGTVSFAHLDEDIVQRIHCVHKAVCSHARVPHLCTCTQTPSRDVGWVKLACMVHALPRYVGPCCKAAEADVPPQCSAALQQHTVAGHVVCGACSIFICKQVRWPDTDEKHATASVLFQKSGSPLT